MSPMCRIRCFLVHAISRIMMSLSSNKKQATILCLSYIPDLILVTALGIGLYIRWSFAEDVTISLFAVLGAIIFAVSCALRYYFGQEDLGSAIFHVWVGMLLGVVAFTSHTELQYSTLEEVMVAMFLTSMVLGCFWNILERMLKLKPEEIKLLKASEGLESLGLIIASLVTGVDSLALSILTLAYVFHVAAIRLQSTMALFSFIAFIFVGIFLFFPALQVTPNIYAFICFVGRHSFSSFLDFYFCDLSMIERWRVLFSKPRLVRCLSLILKFGLDLTLAVVIGIGTSRHKEWYIVLPLFLVLATIWLMFHILVFLTCWKLTGKITECNLNAGAGHSFNRIMEAKGLRYFGLVSQRILFLSMVMTIIIFLVGFETRTPYSLSLLFLVLPVEAAILSLFWELGGNLGGTCIGYAIIAPVTSLDEGKEAQLLSSAAVMEIGSRGTSTLAALQHMFTYHMIHNFGCDYSSSGLELDSLQNKLKSFFATRTTDGPRYDTYLLYYSGDVYNTGAWALSDNKGVTLEMVQNWFQEKNDNSGSRLIMVLDTSSSYKWAQEVPSLDGCILAVQTCRYISRPESAEMGNGCPVGTFTKAYVQFNMGQEVDIDWTSKSRPLRAIYQVSKCWLNFSFHLPTREDVETYWKTNFHSIMKPLMTLINLPSCYSPFCCCRYLVGWVQWLRMRLLPPNQLDTGHGIRLLNT